MCHDFLLLDCPTVCSGKASSAADLIKSDEFVIHSAVAGDRLQQCRISRIFASLIHTFSIYGSIDFKSSHFKTTTSQEQEEMFFLK